MTPPLPHLNSKNILTRLALLLTTLTVTATAEPFYKQSPLFSTAPPEDKSVSELAQLGPVGLAIDFHQPAFTMWVAAVEPGSPAAATGAFKKNQIIQSINDQVLKDIDPRIQLGRIIEVAEATDGVLKCMVKDDAKSAAKEVVVKIPVLGAYSKTWPVNCPKSDKIIRNFADYISQPKVSKGFSGGGMLMLVANGTEKDLAVVRDWVQGLAKQDGFAIPWHIGFAGITVCEYYLKTGDPVAMTVIQRYVRDAGKGEYLDAWSGRGGVPHLGYGNGHLNAGGTQVVTFLMLAKQCGAEIDDSLLRRTLTHFFRFAGRGINPYGDDRPESSFVDNGKHGNLALALAAAASLTPEGEDSIYAKARDICAMTSFYTTTYMLHGHTGGGVGEIWRSAAMCLLQDKKPLQFREFLDSRKWHYDLSRRWDGAFTIIGGAGYENFEWGACYPWAYVLPRKTLRITGAPPTKYSHTYQLPKRPWGVAADDLFLSLEAAPDKDGKRMEVSGETIAKDSGKPLLERFQAQGELSDEEIRRYIRHPEYIIRNVIANHAAGYSIGYMSTSPGKSVRPNLLEEFIRDADPRVRNAGFRAATKIFKVETNWCKNIFAVALERLKDDQESWFVKDACLGLIAKATPEMIIPHLDLLESYLGHSEQWLQNGALVALATAGLDERACDRVMPVIGKFISHTQRQSTTSSTMYLLQKELPGALPKVQAAAKKAFAETYANYDVPLKAAGGLDLANHREQTLGRFAETLASVPGGHDLLYKVSKKESPGKILPHDKLFLDADFDSFGPELRAAILPIIRDQLIYEFIGKNRNRLLNDIANPPVKNPNVENSVDQLVALYQKIGVHDYDWKNFGPDLRNTEWNYFSFEPKEKQAYDKSPWRYRPVTVPTGMEKWSAPDFDAAAAGWKKGLPPFGQYLGKLDDNSVGSRNRWPAKPRSFWENEVLLVRGIWQFPPLKPDHAYRVRADRGQGVGAGDGFKVFLNGKTVTESREGLGRHAGDAIRGGWITKDYAGDFAGGPVTLSALTFLRYGERAIVEMPPKPQGFFQLWLEERKLPPLDQATFRKAAAQMPMLCAEWQAANNPASDEEPEQDLRFRYDGKFVANEKVTGKWILMATVNAVEDFIPQSKKSIGRVPFKTIELRADGSTDSDSYLWSGNTLMQLDQWQALKINPQTIEGSDYLFIESGGFNRKNPASWKPQLMVLKHQ